MDTVFPMLYVASYNELKQLHVKVLLNCHLATFCNCMVYSDSKKWPNDNLMCNNYFSSSLQLATYNIGKTVSTWPQFDINSFSYQLF